MQFKKISVAATFVLASLASSSVMANLVVNGDFEAGDTGWFKTPDAFIAEISPFAHSGVWVGGTNCTGEECVSTAGVGSYLGQTLTTAENSLYTLNFWVAIDTSHPGEFSVFWNGARIADLLATANMVEYSFANLLATGASTAFEIHGRQDDFGIFFDDVSVVGVNNVPEPSSLALIGLGLAGLAFSKRKKV